MYARLSSLFARRTRPAPPAPPPGAGEEPGALEEPDARPTPATPPALVRERRALARRREIELRDVGGLTVEMVRRDRMKPDLLVSRANEVLALEGRMHEVDSLLAAEAAVRGLPSVPHCKCGAPLAPGAHFCSHCGRAAEGAPPVVSCTHCGQPLPAEVNFCPFCGHAVAAEEYLSDTEGDLERPDSTMVRPAPGEERAGET